MLLFSAASTQPVCQRLTVAHAFSVPGPHSFGLTWSISTRKSRPLHKLLIFLSSLLFIARAFPSDRWELQYFYDEDRSSLTINDLKFLSAQRGIAVGYITEKTSIRPSALVTSDGGAHWSLTPLKEIGVNLFFLDDSHGWMVTNKGLWETEEGGRSWRKIKSPRDTTRVFFLDAQHGWAACAHKQVYETSDGGKHWTSLPAAATPSSTPEFTVYNLIAFANSKIGMITGWSRPPRRDQDNLPAWIDPERARRQWPTLTIILETRDGGKTWKSSTASLFGQITRVSLSPDGGGLALLEFSDAFDWPSEVHRLTWKTGGSTLAYREKNRLITDVVALPNGSGFLAGQEPAGKLSHSPIPGKVKILKSGNLIDWTEMDVDYRATARQVTLSALDERHVWAATDTGMILKLTPK